MRAAVVEQQEKWFLSMAVSSLQTATIEHDALLQQAVDFTRGKSPASFDQWFSGVQFEGLLDGVLCLRVRDEFVREWVEDHFLPTLTDHLRERTGWSIQVAWSLGGSLERPVVKRPS